MTLQPCPRRQPVSTLYPGIRITVGTIIGLPAWGESIDSVLGLHPSLEREDILAALADATWRDAATRAVSSRLKPLPPGSRPDFHGKASVLHGGAAVICNLGAVCEAPSRPEAAPTTSLRDFHGKASDRGCCGRRRLGRCAAPHAHRLPNPATQCSSRLAGVFWILASNRQDTAARPNRRISSRSR